MKISKYIIVAFSIFIVACNKNHENVLNNEPVEYTLGIGNNDGKVRIFKSLAQDKDFLIYNGNNLIHKDRIEIIKKYSNLKQIDFKEIRRLAKLHKYNKVKDINKETRHPRTDPVCIFDQATTWTCNIVLLALNTTNMPLSLIQTIQNGIDMWQSVNPNLRIHTTTIQDGDYIPMGHTVIKLYNSSDKFCASTTGMLPDNQGLVYFSTHCDTADVAHNIGHVLGYVDENVRPMSSHYVDIREEAIDLIRNILGESTGDFLEFSLMEMGVKIDTPIFDRNSIMMTYSYSSDPLIEEILKENFSPVLISNNGSDRIFKRTTQLSAEDIRRINKVYPPIDQDDNYRNTCK